MSQFDRPGFERLIHRLWAERRGAATGGPAWVPGTPLGSDRELLRDGLTRAMVDGTTFDRLFEIYLRGPGETDDTPPPDGEWRQVLDRGFADLADDRLVEWATRPDWLAQLWDGLECPSRHWLDASARVSPPPPVKVTTPALRPRPPARGIPAGGFLAMAAGILIVAGVLLWMRPPNSMVEGPPKPPAENRDDEGKSLAYAGHCPMAPVFGQGKMGDPRHTVPGGFSKNMFRPKVTARRSGYPAILHDFPGEPPEVSPSGYSGPEDHQPVEAGKPATLEQLFITGPKRPARLLILVTDKPAAEALARAVKGGFPPVDPDQEAALLAAVDQALARHKISRVDHGFLIDPRPETGTSK